MAKAAEKAAGRVARKVVAAVVVEVQLLQLARLCEKVLVGLGAAEANGARLRLHLLRK